MIPTVFAEILARLLDTKVDVDIAQLNRVGHTGSGGFHRLATPALFGGDVAAGQNYLIVDDFVGQGGTIANIKGHIEAQGGVAVMATALRGRPYLLQSHPQPNSSRS